MSIYKRFEVTIMDEPISEIEEMWFDVIADRSDINYKISKSGRIMTFDNIDDIKTLTGYLSDFGIAEDVGLIREIIEYEPEWLTLEGIDNGMV